MSRTCFVARSTQKVPRYPAGARETWRGRRPSRLYASTNTRVRCPRTHKRETRKKTKTTEKRHGTHRASAQPTVSMSRATSAPTQRSQPLLLATLAQPPMALSCSSGMNHTHVDHERRKRKTKSNTKRTFICIRGRARQWLPVLLSLSHSLSAMFPRDRRFARNSGSIHRRRGGRECVLFYFLHAAPMARCHDGRRETGSRLILLC